MANSSRISETLGIDLTRQYLDDGWRPDQDNMFSDLFAMAVMNFDLSSDPKRVVAALEGIANLMHKKYGTQYTIGQMEDKLTQLRIRHKAFRYWRTIPGVIFDEINYQAAVTETYWTTVAKHDEPPLFFHFHNNCCFLETRLHRIFEWPGVAIIHSDQPIINNDPAGPSTSTVPLISGNASSAHILIPDDEVDLVAIQKDADILYGGHKMLYYTCDASGKNIRPVDDRDSLFLHKYRRSESEDEDEPGYPEDGFPEDAYPGGGVYIVPDTP